MLHAVPAAEVVSAGSDREAADAALRLLGADQRGAGSAAAQPGAGTQGAPVPEQEGQGQQQQHQQQQQNKRPPHLIWVHLGELWWHLEACAARLAAQVRSQKAAMGELVMNLRM